MLENIPYYLDKEGHRQTSKALVEANRDHLAQTAQNGETSGSNTNKLHYHHTESIWWARVWQTTRRWFKPANA